MRRFAVTARRALSASAGSKARNVRRGFYAVLAVAAVTAIGLYIRSDGERRTLECVTRSVLPCEEQSLELALPLPGLSVSLAYSSRRVLAAEEDPRLRALLDTYGLGGWSLDVVHGFDARAGVVHWGDGTSERLTAVPIRAGAHAGLKAIAEPDGETVHLFDDEGRHVRTVDGRDGRTLLLLRYDARGRLERIVDGNESELTVTRDAASRSVTLATTAGRRATVSLDRRGYATLLKDTTGAETAIEPDGAGLVSRLVLPEGRSYLYAYDRDGRLAEARDPMGVTTRWRRESVDGGHSVTTTDSSGATSTWTRTSASGRTTTTLRGPDGLAVREVVQGGTVSIGWPDGTTMRMRLADDPRWGSQVPATAEMSLRTADGSPVTGTTQVLVTGGDADPFAATAIEERRAWDGDTVTRRWDRERRTITTTSPEGRKTTSTLDPEGRLERVVPAGGAEQRLAYDDVGRLASIRWAGARRGLELAYGDDDIVVDMAGRVDHRIELDAAGRPSRVQVSEAGYATLDRADDGAVVAVNPDGGAPRRFERVEDGRAATFEPGMAPPAIAWSYDAHGRPAGHTDGDGQELRVEYDEVSRPARALAGDRTVDYRWDASTGRLAAIEGSDVSLAFEYARGAVVSEAWSGLVSGRVRRQLDSRGLPAEITVGASRIPIERDRDGLVLRAGPTTVVRDRASGDITRLTDGVTSEQRTYDDLGLLSSVRVTAGNAAVYRLTLERDELGRAARRTERFGSGPARTTAFTYDGWGQLLAVRVDGRETERYAYDDRGNRVRARTAGAGARRATFDDADRILTDGATTFAHTAAGRLAGRTDERGTLELAYDAFGNLSEVRPPQGPAVSYDHDGRGRRVARSVGGAPDGGLLYLDAQRPAATVARDGRVESVFTYADDGVTPTAMIRQRRTYRIVTDDTGSPRLVVDTETGEIVERLDYDAFGQTIADTAPGTQPFGFGGGILDRASGLVRFGARDYDPATGRWTALDPILYDGGDANLYRYAGNDPVNQSDPSGLNPRKKANKIGACLFYIVSLAADCAPGLDRHPSVPPGVPAHDPGAIVSDELWPLHPYPLRPPPSPTRVPAPRPGDPRVPAERFDPKRYPRGDPRRDSARRPRGFRGRRAFSFLLCSPIECIALIKELEGELIEDATNTIDSLEIPDPPDTDGADGGAGAATDEPSYYCGTPTQCMERFDRSRVNGDPHISTFDGLSLDFQAAGEFVYATSKDFIVQTRFQGEVGANTGTKATAVRAAGHVVEVIYDRVKAGRNGLRVPVRIDGREVTVTDKPLELDGAQVGAVRDQGRDSVYVATKSGWFLAIENNVVAQNVLLFPPERARSRGLAGTPDGDRGNDLRRRDGSRLPLDTLETVAGLYGRYAREWRVRPDERLFTDTPAARWRTPAMLALPKLIISLGDLPAAKVAAARKVCVDAGVPAGQPLEDCTYDVAVSGDADWARQQAESDTIPTPDTPGEQRPADDPLLLAADRCDDDELGSILAGDASTAIRSIDGGWTALMLAAQHDCPQTVSALLAGGASTEDVAEDGAFALYVAAQNGHLDVVRALADDGARLELALPGGDTPLLIATFGGHQAVVAELLRRGVDPDIARADGVTPVIAAAQEAALPALRSLLRAGADADRATLQQRSTALHLSADGDPDIVSALLRAGVDVDRRDASGNTALHYAASAGAGPVVRLLLDAGADRRLRNGLGHTPLAVADESIEALLAR